MIGGCFATLAAQLSQGTALMEKASSISILQVLHSLQHIKWHMVMGIMECLED
jgi:hypothetical protein